MARSKEAIKRAQAEYAKKCTNIRLQFNNESDADVIEWLNAQTNRADAIRQLIRRRIVSEK